MVEVSRRTVLRALGVAGAAAASGALTLGLPAPTAAQQLGQQESVQDGLKRVFGGRPMKDGSGLIKLDMPFIAENGAVVPVSVDIGTAPTATDYVKHIYIVADKNRIPVITRVTLAPEAGQASIGANVRLGETTEVRVIAEKNDGSLWQVKREVKVTVGGCGG